MTANSLPRHAAGSFKLPEDAGPITAMCSFGKFLEIYTLNKTYHFQTPDILDPEQKDPNAPFITTQTHTVGSQNPIVARIILQSDQILKAAWFKHDVDKPAVLTSLYTCKEELLSCEKIALKISKEIDEIISKIEKEGVPIDDQGRHVSSFPNVPDLHSQCSTFLTHAKRAINHISSLPGLFITLPRKDKNFDKLAKTLTETIGKDELLTQFVSSNASHIERIISLRNFLEHPGEKITILDNFHYIKGNKIALPQWRISEEEPNPIKDEMNAIVNYLLEVTEAILIHLVLATKKNELPYIIIKIEDSKINPEKPIKFELSIDMSKLKLKN